LKLEKRKDAKPNKKAFLSFEIYTYGIGPKFPENNDIVSQINLVH